MVTRRAFLKTSATLLVLCHYRSLTAEDAKARLVRELSKAQSALCSPDGKKLVFHDWNVKNGGMHRVIEIETGRVLFNASFKAYRGMAFADRDNLFVLEAIGLSPKDPRKRQTVVNIYSKESTERILTKDDPYYGAIFVPVDCKRLLAMQTDNSTHLRSSLSLVEFPSFREIAKVPYTPEPRLPMTKIGGMSLSNDFDLKVSASRKMLAYSCDHTLLCRDVEDLKILWMQEIEPPLKVHLVAISPDGGHVAGFAVNSQWARDQTESVIFIFNGKTGALEARMPIQSVNNRALSPSGNGFDISPDGKKFAVVDIAEENDTWWVRIHIHEIPTGKRLVTLLHDKIGDAKRTRLPAFTTAHFALDGHYLITSGINTKIWSIEQNI